jgi:hypothetical protein
LSKYLSASSTVEESAVGTYKPIRSSDAHECLQKFVPATIKLRKKRAKDADGMEVIKITSDRAFLSRRDIRQPGAILQRNKTIGEEFWEKNSVSADVP